MKHIYFISNNLMSPLKVVYPKETSFEEARKQTILSVKGEELAKSLVHRKEFEKIDAIYASSYASAINTAKYMAEEKKLDVLIDKRLDERVVGNLGSNEFRYLKGMQEHDFNYKLENGESINEVQKRMEDFLLDILLASDANILIITHNIALLSLLTKYCSKGYNLYDHLILDYHDEVIYDGTFHDMDIIEFVYDEDTCVGFRRVM